MSLANNVRLSAGAVILFCVFVAISSARVFLAVFVSILLHEMGHYLILRHYHGGISQLSATAMGFIMRTDSRLTYGQELLALFGGPVSNLMAFVLLGLMGHIWEDAYLFGGAQLIVGIFNLLPICGLDGSSILWILAALLWYPDLADRITARVSIGFSGILVIFAAALVYKHHGGVLLLWTALGLFLGSLHEIGLVKCTIKR